MCIAIWRPSADSSAVLPDEFERDHHADLAEPVGDGGVDVVRDDAGADRKRCSAAQRHVLADGRNRISDRGLDGDAADFRRLDLLDVIAGVERDLRDHLHEALKLIVTRDEVGLRVEFDHGAFGACRNNADQALGGDAAGLLGGLRQAFFAQPVDRSFHVPVRSR